MAYEPLEIEPEPMIEVEVSKADLRMSYGQYRRPRYDDITLTSPLADEYVPTKENGRRLIVIGDIHGMLDPLNELLKKTGFNPAKDHVISVGDMVNKGPKSAEVVNRLMELNATAVRGNHEDRVLVAWDGVNSQHDVEALLDNAHEALRRGEDKDLSTARKLSAQQIEWIRGLPVVLTIESLGVYVVHAGLVPGLPIPNQDPWAVMNMRTLRFPREEFRKKEEAKKRKKLEEEKKKEEERIKKLQQEQQEQQEEKEKQEKQEKQGQKREEKEEDGTAKIEILQIDHGSPSIVPEVPEPRATAASEDSMEKLLSHPDHDILIPVDNRDGEPWSDIWNHFQKKLDSKLRRTIIYGHDAKLGYRESTYSYGLDSACVKGHALTALVISGGEAGSFNRTTTQVICQETKDSNWW